MGERIRRVDYYYVEVPDQAGEALRVLSGLKENRVNLLACCGFPIAGGLAQLDMVPEEPEAFRKVAGKLSLKLSGPKQAFLLQGDDRIGAVAEVLAKLRNEGVNLIGSQAVSAGGGRWGMIFWVKPSDYDRAAKALGI